MDQSLYYYKAIITDVYDADTVTADIDLGCGVWLREEKLRLYGINAPEMRGPEKPQGIISRDWLRAQILNDNKPDYVMIKTIKDKTGKYGRLLAVIYKQTDCSWIDINALMVDSGYAEYKEY